MDAVAQLASQAAIVLAPFLPQLLRIGQEVALDTAQDLHDKGWNLAAELWATLRPKIETKPAAQEAVQEVAAQPNDEDSLATLRVQLRKLFAEQPALREEVEAVINAAKRTGALTVDASGERSVAIGSDVT